MDNTKPDDSGILCAAEDSICGVDIGGANIKYATVGGRTYSCRFPMWRMADRLSGELRHGFQQVHPEGRVAHLAVTMTAELADCFDSRRSGVQHILQHVVQAAPQTQICVYSVEGKWLSIEEASDDPWKVAASNWHAMTRWAAQLLDKSIHGDADFPFAESAELGVSSADLACDGMQAGLVIDVGSTTVDIIPFCGRDVWTQARTDRDRLQSQQLIYTGLERTPVSAILPAVELQGQSCPLMAERFADSGDAYRVLGELAEEADNCDTADGRSRTRENSEARLARMVGEDLETLSRKELDALAGQIVAAQMRQILAGVHSNLDAIQKSLCLSDYPDKPLTIVLCGHGKPILDRLQKQLSNSQLRITDLANWVGESISRCAPAMSVATLLQTHLHAESQLL